MSAREQVKRPNVRELVSPEEWQVRVDLAAAYRLVASYGWDDLVFTHISARVPGPEHHFLINPYGMMFEEITASSLVKVDLNGQIVMDSEYKINPAGFTIHSAVHAAREDALCVMHLHTNYGTAVSMQKNGLLPLSQQALTVMSLLKYHAYEGVAFDTAERERDEQAVGERHRRQQGEAFGRPRVHDAIRAMRFGGPARVSRTTAPKLLDAVACRTPRNVETG